MCVDVGPAHFLSLPLPTSHSDLDLDLDLANVAGIRFPAFVRSKEGIKPARTRIK